MGTIPAVVQLGVTLLTLLLGCHQEVQSDLTVKPVDSESLVNGTTYFNCSSPITAKDIHWYHYPVGVEAYDRKFVYAFEKFYKDYEEDFELDKNSSNGAYNLVIKSVKPEYAGRYECQDDGGTGNIRSAQLIVLDDKPECNSDINSDGVIGSNPCGILPDEELHLSCGISYHGNIPPELKWIKLGGNEPIIENVTMAQQSLGRFTYNLTIKADEIKDESSFECQTTKFRTSKHGCYSEMVKLLYIYNEPYVSVRSIGEEVYCSANTSSQSCQYKWKWYDKANSLNVSNDRILKLEKEGQYLCEATCYLRDEQCTVNAMLINATISDTAAQVGSDFTIVVLVALLVIFMCIIVIVVTVFMHHRQKRRQGGTFCSWCKTSNAEETQVEEAILLNEDPMKDASSLLNDNRIPEEEKIVKDGTNKVSENSAQEAHPLLQISGTTEDNAIVIPDDEQADDGSATPLNEKPGMHPELLHVQSFPRPSDEKTGICGLTVLNKELFVAFERTSELKVFQAISFSPVHSVVVMGLDNPLDMVSCQADRSLYISSSKKIYKIDASGKVIREWPIEDGGGTLSVTHDQTVILSDWKRSALTEYSADGEYLCKVNLPSDFHPFHALKLSGDQFVVSYEQRMVHKVSRLDGNGTVIQSFSGMLKFPKYLVVNSDGCIFVADQKNSRVLIMSRTLEPSKVFLLDNDKLGRPQRICLDEANSRMFVADIKEDNNRFMVFRLQKHRTGAIENSAENQNKPNQNPKEDSGVTEYNISDNEEEEDVFSDAQQVESQQTLEGSQQTLEGSQQTLEGSRGEKRKR